MKRMEWEKKKKADEQKRIENENQELLKGKQYLAAVRERDEQNKQKIEEAEQKIVRKIQMKKKMKREALIDKQTEQLQK